MNKNERIELARNAHKQGYNCAQAVILAYLDSINISKEDAMKVSYGFGGGVGATREICGTLTGAAMVIGYVFGKEEADLNQKKAVYQIVSDLCEEFREIHGSIVCGELLGLRVVDHEVNKLPCNDLVAEVVCLLEKYVIES